MRDEHAGGKHTDIEGGGVGGMSWAMGLTYMHPHI